MAMIESTIRPSELQPHHALWRGLASAADAAGTTVICVPAPHAPLEVVMRHFPDEPFCLWAPPEGTQVIGVGTVQRCITLGSERCAHLREWCRAMESEIRVHWAFAGSCPPPRLLGGISFAPGSCSGAAWEEFGDGWFMLPRWTYLRDAERAFLYLALRSEEHAALMATLRQWSTPRQAPADLERARPNQVVQLPLARWREQVDAARALIQRGGACKIVIARRTDIDLSAPVDPASVLERMAEDRAGCTRFGCARNAVGPSRDPTVTW